MVVLELFAGTSSVGNAFKDHGHEVFTVDYDKRFDVTSHADVGSLGVQDVLDMTGGRYPDVIWASPDCTTYSVAAMSRHRRKDPYTGWLMPISDYAKQCDAINQHLMRLIQILGPKLWFIENPRGAMRKMPWMLDLPRYTVTYCQYGAKYMKPTDIWTNHPNPMFKPPCHNGDPCHESASRGSKHGLQSISGGDNKVVRSVIPRELCEHVADICEEYICR